MKSACAKIKVLVFWCLWLLQIFFACGWSVQSMHAIRHLSICCRKQAAPGLCRIVMHVTA